MDLSDFLRNFHTERFYKNKKCLAILKSVFTIVQEVAILKQLKQIEFNQWLDDTIYTMFCDVM